MKTTAKMILRKGGVEIEINRKPDGEAGIRVGQMKPVRRKGSAPLKDVHERLMRLGIKHHFTTAVGEKRTTWTTIPGTHIPTYETSWNVAPGMPPTKALMLSYTHPRGEPVSAEHGKRVERLIAALKKAGIKENAVFSQKKR